MAVLQCVCLTPPPSLPPQVWDIHTYALVKTLPSQNHWVRTLVVSGKYLYSGSYQAVKVGVAKECGGCGLA